MLHISFLGAFEIKHDFFTFTVVSIVFQFGEFLHDVRGEFTDDVSEPAAVPNFTAHESERSDS
jgi:hypothetical protein